MSKINGIVGILGGVVNVEVNKTFQLYPYLVIDYELISGVQPSKFAYVSSDPTVASVGANTGVISGLTVNQATQVTITYTDAKGNTYKDIIDVFVRPAGWFPPEPTPEPSDWALPENILKDKHARDEDGDEMVGTAEVYVSDTTLYMPSGLIPVS